MMRKQQDVIQSQSNRCPECGRGKMYFTGDGRFRVCERCQYRVEVAKPEHNLQKLKDDTALLPIQSTTQYRQGQAYNMRLSLARGIGAAKAGEMDEAYFYLTRVLSADWDEEDRANAWLWLSQVVGTAEEKKYCLEQVLALKPTHQVARRGLAVLNGRLNPADIIDPDKLEREISDLPGAVDVEQFTCPQCAGRMNYSADGRVLLCEFCNFQQELDAAGKPKQQARFGQGAFEQEFAVAMATAKGHLQPIHMRTFHCHNCAVEFVLAPETISFTCPYCHGVYVAETAESQEIVPPHALIPFAISLNEAMMALRGWFKKHKIEGPRLSPLVGIYLPVWTFDIGGEMKWSGLERREDKWVWTNGSFLPFFDDVLVPGNKKLDPSLTRRFGEYNLSHLVAYDARYLADWSAERYQIPLSDASLLARKQVMNEIRRNKNHYLKGKMVLNFRMQPGTLIIESYKHILLPLWIAHYKVEGQEYDVTINGFNGRVHGDRPQGIVGRFFSRLLG